jgi:glycosyl transferase family 87
VLELGACSALLVWIFVVHVLRRNAFATDFHYAFWPAARHVLDGVSPYPSVVDFGRLPFVYPAPAAVLLGPFGLLPRGAADVLFTVLLVAATVLTLRLCRVQDWRCYGFAFLWAPVFSALQAANITLLLAAGLALLWRVRDRPLAAAGVTAILVAVKLFLWPLLVWIALWRGFRTAGLSILLTLALTISSWSVIGFAGFREYPHLVRLVEHVEATRSYSLAALGATLGLGHTAATWFALAGGTAALIGVVVLARRENDGRTSFALTIAATILFSPVVWLHYFSLLLVPVALLRPRFGPLWLLPLLLWPCPVMLSAGTFWPLAPLIVFALMFAAMMRRPPAWRIARLTQRYALS